MTTDDRYRIVTERFSLRMPDPCTELDYATPFQLLVAVILSAQCTDRRVNTVTPPLFKAFPTPGALAGASPEQVFQIIKSISYPNAKTRHIIAAADVITRKFGGQIPDNLPDLLSIPGVGRKTANVILSVVWNKPAMAVDTHVFRVSNRIGLTTDSRSPLQTEKALVAGFPPEILPKAHHWLILHGRYTCTARNPNCSRCFLTDICIYNSRKSNK